MLSRDKVGMITAEFLGTAILALTALSASQYFNFTAAWYVSLSVGISLAVLVGVIGRVSGAHVNPAITIGLWTLRKIPTPQALVYIAAQLLGGAVALAFFEYVRNVEVLPAATGSLDGRMFVAEMVGTAIFAFGVAGVVTQKIEGMQAAFTVGMSLTVGILIASLGSSGFLNPAVALANNSWDKLYVLAPLFGAVLGMQVYSMLLAPAESLMSSKKKKK